MLAFLPLIMAALQAFPALIAAIKAAEAAFTTEKAGPQKKAVVMAAVSVPNAPPEFTAHLSNMVDNHVSALNAAKVFKASAAEPAGTIEPAKAA